MAMEMRASDPARSVDLRVGGTPPGSSPTPPGRFVLLDQLHHALHVAAHAIAIGGYLVVLHVAVMEVDV